MSKNKGEKNVSEVPINEENRSRKTDGNEPPITLSFSQVVIPYKLIGHGRSDSNQLAKVIPRVPKNYWYDGRVNVIGKGEAHRTRGHFECKNVKIFI